jgi:hypothetical protein
MVGEAEMPSFFQIVTHTPLLVSRPLGWAVGQNRPVRLRPEDGKVRARRSPEVAPCA